MIYSIPVILGSKKDLVHAENLKKQFNDFCKYYLDDNNYIKLIIRVCSAHKDSEYLKKIMRSYDNNVTINCYISIAGKSNALSAVVDGMTFKPVIAMPPIKSSNMYDLYSSVSLPSGVSPMLVLGYNNCFLAVLKILGLTSYKIRTGLESYRKNILDKIRIDDISLKYNHLNFSDMIFDIGVNHDNENVEFIRSGKVRDIYQIKNENKLLLKCTNKLSAYDRNICEVPFKGTVLNLITAWWFNKTSHLVPNHMIDNRIYSRDIMVKKCKPIMIEFVVRSYMTGTTKTSIWMNYKNGVRNYCGNKLPEGLVKNQRLPKILLTPTTKGETDELISPDEIIKRGIMTKEDWDLCADYALRLFKFGQKEALKKGMILVDTKYEFGHDVDGNILVIDEIHTPDSSRYWINHSYNDKFSSGEEPENIDKDIIRKWIKKHYDPYSSSEIIVPTELVETVSRRYIQLYEIITGEHIF